MCRDDVVLRQVVSMMVVAEERLEASSDTSVSVDQQSATGRHARRPAKSSTRVRAHRKRRSSLNSFGFLPYAAAATIAVLIGVLISLMPSAATPTPTVAEQPPIIPHNPSPTPQTNPTVVPDVLEVVSGSGIAKTIDGEIAIGQRIPPGRTVRISDGEVTMRWLADGSQLSMAAHSEVLLGDATSPIQLLNGTITAQIVKQKDSQFSIIGPHATVSVKGTAFSVTASASETSLTVTEGRVHFLTKADNTALELLAGETISANANGLIREKDSYIVAFVPVIAQVARPIGGRWYKRITVRLADLPAEGMNIRVDGAPEVKCVECKWPGPSRTRTRRRSRTASAHRARGRPSCSAPAGGSPCATGSGAPPPRCCWP
jgi:ferric-dicitrate binding protein FerR (iron transport regulator)